MAETFNERLERRTQQALDKVIESEKETMSAGALKDHADYRYHAGRIAGLRTAKETLEQALSDIQKN